MNVTRRANRLAEITRLMGEGSERAKNNKTAVKDLNKKASENKAPAKKAPEKKAVAKKAKGKGKKK